MGHDARKGEVEHLVYVRIADDTNIWAQGQNRKGESNFQTEGKTMGRSQKGTGAKKVVQVLGIVQRLALRMPGQEYCVCQVHAPSQVLPQANAYTIRNRIHEWSVLSAAGCSPHMGGQALAGLLQKIGLKIIVTCTIAAI